MRATMFPTDDYDGGGVDGTGSEVWEPLGRCDVVRFDDILLQSRGVGNTSGPVRINGSRESRRTHTQDQSEIIPETSANIADSCP